MLSKPVVTCPGVVTTCCVCRAVNLDTHTLKRSARIVHNPYQRKAALQINSLLQLEKNPLAQSLWGHARLRCVVAGNHSDSNACVAPGPVCALACVRVPHPLVLLVEGEHSAPHRSLADSLVGMTVHVISDAACRVAMDKAWCHVQTLFHDVLTCTH